MRKLFYLFFVFFYISKLHSQSTLTVINSETEKPIKGAIVTCNSKILGKTNNLGIVNFTTNCNEVSVEINRYVGDVILVEKNMILALEKEHLKEGKIQEVVISNKSDSKALEIINQTYKRFKKNSPNELDSYSYKSYEKVTFDLDKDSLSSYSHFMDVRKDSLSKLSNRFFPKKEKERKDSLRLEQILNVNKNSKVFLWERAMEYLFSKKYGEKVQVLDNRISGLKNPVYEMLVMMSNRDKIPKEILPENRTLYRFYLTDSIEIDNRMNYVIRFRQIDKKVSDNVRKFNGYLYIDKKSFAIKILESNSKVKSEGERKSVWIPINEKWFLKSENLRMKVGVSKFETIPKKSKESADEKKERNKSAKKFGRYAYMKTDYFDFRTPVELSSSQFQGYSMGVENTDGKLLDHYRTDSLTSREKLTYVKIDSLGEKYNFDRKVKIISGLLRANFKFGMVDINPLQTRYNQYEGFRLGAGFKLNNKFNKYISPDFYLAYGFSDHRLKQGIGVDFRTNLDRNSYFRVEYFNDVEASGRFSQNMWNAKMTINNGGITMRNDKYYKYDGFRLGYQVDLSNSLTLDVSGKRQHEESGVPYRFLGMSKRFTNFSTMATIKFSPKNRNVMTPNGKFTYEQNFPEAYFNYEQGFNSLGGDYNYSRFDILITHQIKSILGTTSLHINGGYFAGKAPLWHLFEMGGLDSNKGNTLFSNFSLTSYLGFGTMVSGRYFNDKFVGYFFSHRIPWYFKSFGKNTSSFNIISRGIIGNLRKLEYHQVDNISPLDHFYQELGLSYNNFLSSRFNLALFYRVGYYASNGFKDNFAVQLRIKLLEF